MADGEGLIIKIFADAKDFNTGVSKAIGDAKSKFKGLGDELGKELKRVETVGTTAFKGITGAIGVMATAATAAIGGMVKDSVSAFAEYEQLEGGVATMFKNDAEYIINRASAAFRTAGVSANKYMEAVTSFSASLIQSLGGDTRKAAEYADRAMVDMSDNANKMGTDISSIQNAYQGFAKQNYTMLDNLKLGYGGTKEEMARLISDASKLKDVQKELGITVDANSMSFGNIVNAISVMQKQMGIAGTTSEEAEKTISGSLNMMSAAWENLKTNLLQGEIPLDESINDLIYSVEKVIQNAGPAIEKSLKGLGMLIEKALPALLDFGIPALINSLLPGIGKAAVAIAQSFGNVLVSALGSIDIGKTNVFLVKVWQIGSEIINNITKGILDNIVSIRNVASQIITYFQFGIEAILPNILEIAKEMVYTFAEGFLTYKYLVMEIGIKMINAISEGLAEALPDLLDEFIPMLLNLIDMLAENLPKFIDSLISMISTIADSIMDWLPEILGSIGNLVYTLCNKILDNLPQILDDAVKIVAAVLAMIAEILLAALISIGQHLVNWWNSSIKPWFDKTGDSIRNFFSTLGKVFETWWNTTIRPWFEKIKTDIKTKIEEIKTNVTNKVEEIKSKVSEKVKNIFDTVVNTIQELPGRMLDIGKNIVEGIWDGISSAADWIGEKVSGFVNGITNGVKGILGINSPSKVFAQIGAYMGEGLAEGLESETGTLQKTAEKQIGQLTGIYDGLRAGMPQINLAGRMNALRMGQSVQTITNDNGNVFNFYQTFAGAGADAGEEMFRQFQRKVRYSGGVL